MRVNFKELCQQNVVKNNSPGYNVRDEYKHLSVAELQEITSKDRLPFAVCALNITGDMNVGVMMRTAHLLGAERFIIMGRRKYDKRSTVGAQNYIPLDRVEALDSNLKINKKIFDDYMHENKYKPVFIEQGGYEIDPTGTVWENECAAWSMYPEYAKKICFVYGNEGMGIDPELMEGNNIYSLRQRGVMRSLNVSSAMAIVTYSFISAMGFNNRNVNDDA